MQSKRYYYRFIRGIYILLDLIIINLCFFFSYLTDIEFDSPNRELLIYQGAYNVVWFLVISTLKAYETRHVFSFSKVIREIFQAILVHFLVMTAIIFFSESTLFSKNYFLLVYGFLIVLLPFARLFLLYLLMLYRRSGFNYINIVFIGADRSSMNFYRSISNDSTLGLRVKGFFGKNLENVPENLQLGGLDEIKEYCLNEEVGRIYCASSELTSKELNDLMVFADENLIRTRIFPSLGNFTNRAVDLELVEGIPVINVRSEPLENNWNKQMKRGFDVVFSFVVLVTLFPVLTVLLGLLIKLESRGPVFFKQLRTGKDRKPFFCYKFRSMTINRDSDFVQATKGDVRLTRIGSFMRKTSLDEIPQFLNVLRGEMSIVGPRPHMLQHSEEYSKIISKFYVRHFVKPGITGWAQVRGYRGATEDPSLMEKRVEHDVWYLENWNFWLDLKIVVLTVLNVVKGEENAY